MPRIQRFKVRIQTGAHGTEGPVRFDFNGHTMTFRSTSGGTSPGEIFEGSFDPMSVAHSVALVGPDEGTWDVDRIDVTYETGETEPYTVSFGAVRLDDSNAVNIWRDRPMPIFDV